MICIGGMCCCFIIYKLQGEIFVILESFNALPDDKILLFFRPESISRCQSFMAHMVQFFFVWVVSILEKGENAITSIFSFSLNVIIM